MNMKNTNTYIDLEGNYIKRYTLYNPLKKEFFDKLREQLKANDKSWETIKIDSVDIYLKLETKKLTMNYLGGGIICKCQIQNQKIF